LYISIGTADTLQATHGVVKQMLKDKGVSLRDLLPRLFQPAAR
jgi:hypothetical protein